VRIELRGLELFGYHGVHEHERQQGQRFLYDVELEVGERGWDDRIEDAVDYSRVAAAVREVAGGQFRLLEALAAAIADLLAERFEPEWVKVRVRKPEVRPAGIDLEFAAVTVERRPRRLMLAYIGLGSNLGDRDASIRQAAALIGAGRLSTIRETKPWGVPDQPSFLNAVAELETREGAQALLARLLSIERELGRVRDGTRWGPRTIDLDLLVYGDECHDEARLTVPHPALAERLFVLEPLAELAPDLVVPGLGPVSGLLTRLQSSP
jgi:dihydroneopterin aldolase / 2-amino-4-hydroxy-6-hydroxymethyldihydropteridine diphosphokinase